MHDNGHARRCIDINKNINTDLLIHKGILGERGSQCVSGTQRRAPSKTKTLNICLVISCYFQVHLLHTILQQVSHLLSWFKFLIHKSFTISWNEKSSSILLQEPSKQSSNTDSCGNLADSYWLCIYLWQFQRYVNLYLWQNQHNMNLYLWRFQRYLYLFVTIFLLKVFRTVSCDYSSQYIYYPLFIVIIKFHIFSWELIPSVIFSTSICVVRWWNE